MDILNEDIKIDNMNREYTNDCRNKEYPSCQVQEKIENSEMSAEDHNEIVINRQSERDTENQSERLVQSEEAKLLPDSDSLSKSVIVPSFSFNKIKTITGSWNEFRHKVKQVFLKGCKWSPDGTCLLTNSDDGIMRLFDLPLQLYNCHCLPNVVFPELQSSVKTKIGGQVYDYTWYPLMTSVNPATCCFATTASWAPIQLWDAYTGDLRCSYLGYSPQDEMQAAYSIAFSPCGSLILCGYENRINIFNTDRPGRDCYSLATKGLCDQRGIISCFAVNPSMPNIFAAGSYNKSVGMYSMDGHAMCLLMGQGGGLTQLRFSQDGTRLYAAGRKDHEILCWDLRNMGQILYVLQRPHRTNQRIYFDISADDRYLLSGSSDGVVRVWDLQSVLPTDASDSGGNVLMEPLTKWKAHNDCVNGVSFHRQIPMVATASGQRYFPQLAAEDADDVFVLERPQDKCEESVKLWWTGPIKEEDAEMKGKFEDES